MMSYKSDWYSAITNEKEEFLELLEMDPFEYWEENRNPETIVEQELYDGLSVLYSGLYPSLGKKFIERSISVAERALGEKKLENEVCKQFLPKNHARLLRAYVYAKFFGGEDLDCSLLMDASKGFYQWASEGFLDEWDDHSEWALLSSIRLSLLCDSRSKAKDMLLSSPNFKFNGLEKNVLQRLIEGDFSSASLALYTEFYDEIRQPSSSVEYFRDPDMHRIELGLLKVKFFTKGSESLSGKAVISSISKE